MDTVARGEQVEAELDTFIARRHDKRVKEEGGERAAEEAWVESARRQAVKLRRENTAAWYGYLMDSADRTERVAAEIAAEKRAQAQKLLEEGAA